MLGIGVRRRIHVLDNAYTGPLVLDLANTLMWICSAKGYFATQTARKIYSAYKKVRKLHTREQQSLFSALHYAYLSHMLVDMYLFCSKKDRLPLRYIRWGITNLLTTESKLPFDQRRFQQLFS